jgi:hypothetical protein
MYLVAIGHPDYDSGEVIAGVSSLNLRESQLRGAQLPVLRT